MLRWNLILKCSCFQLHSLSLRMLFVCRLSWPFVLANWIKHFLFLSQLSQHQLCHECVKDQLLDYVNARQLLALNYKSKLATTLININLSTWTWCSLWLVGPSVHFLPLKSICSSETDRQANDRFPVPANRYHATTVSFEFRPSVLDFMLVGFGNVQIIYGCPSN